MSPDLKWFLPSKCAGVLWGAGSYNLRRSEAGEDTWDNGCRVTPLIGGYEAIADMRAQLRDAVADAAARTDDPAGERGHVYIAGWRFNSACDLHDPYDPTSDPALADESALGWVLRLMQAGISVRVLLWMPARVASQSTFAENARDHMYVARVIQAYSAMHTPAGATSPLGVCLLDRRLPRVTSSHHQKMMIVRVGDIDVAYCGGIDLAYTRKDTPDLQGSHPLPYTRDRPQFLGGDPQSGKSFMLPQSRDPKWIGRCIGGLAFPKVALPTMGPGDDLPDEVYGPHNQYWHDQHVKIEGPAVAALEWVFCERWVDDFAQPALVLDSSLLDRIGNLVGVTGPLASGEVIVTTPEALTVDRKVVAALPEPASVLPLASASPAGDSGACVQLWRTIPLRNRGSKPSLFRRGEFTVMAGVANAIRNATELIWIIDQYFWSMPMAAQLNAQLYAQPGLRVIIVVPPHADTIAGAAHWARRKAYDALTWVDPSEAVTHPNGVRDALAAYALWHAEQGRGIYSHAKAHIYDANLLLIGSANCNSRSFTGDTEVVAAIQDRSATYTHMVRLWSVLLPHSPWPWGPTAGSPDALPVTTPGWGRIFFNAFTIEANKRGATAGQPLNNIIPDTVCSGEPLPNGVTLKLSKVQHWFLDHAGDALEAHGIKPTIETAGAPGTQGITPLIDIADLVQYDPSWRMPP